jgi:acetone carboxylase gamma subunit
MSDFSHDPSEYVRGIQQILVSDKKKIGFLFGAGSSLACKDKTSPYVPAIAEMTRIVVENVGKISVPYAEAILQIQDELQTKFNVETLLSNLEQKAKLVGAEKLNGLAKADFESLILAVKNEVRELVSVHRNELKTTIEREIVKNLIQTDFARWIGQADRKYPIEIFTTNYDFLFELGLEYNEVPYYDGFCGSFRPFFNPSSVEDLAFLSNQTKVWKIHGSLGWHYDKDTEKILRVHPDAEDILIYPSTLKYKDSKKQPYESLMDRLSNFLKQDDAILITCGYSWGDEHINSRITSALKTDTTSHVVGLIYDKFKNDGEKEFSYGLTSENAIVKIGEDNPKISLYGQRHAVIGRKYGEWTLKTEPHKEDTISINLFFDEDGYTNMSEALKENKIGDQKWTGKGEFILPDFIKLVEFLNSMISENEIGNMGKELRAKERKV